MKKIILILLPFYILGCDAFHCFDRCLDQANKEKLMCTSEECKQTVEEKLQNCTSLCSAI
jgi:hypothetical protein